MFWLKIQIRTGFPSSSAGKQSACRRPRFNSWVGKIPWRRDRLPTLVFLGFPGGSDGKESACNVGDLGSIPELERSPGRGHDNPLQYSCLENPHGQRSLGGYSLWSGKESDTATFKICNPSNYGFPSGSDSKEATCNAGDLGSIPGLGRSPGGRHGNPL